MEKPGQARKQQYWASCPWAFPRERGLPSPPAFGGSACSARSARCHGHPARGDFQCKSRAGMPVPHWKCQGATGILPVIFPVFNPHSEIRIPAIDRGVEPPRHQGTKKYGLSRRGAEAQRGAAAPPKAGDRRQGTGDRRQETGDRGQETGDRRQEAGDRGQETGDRRQQRASRGASAQLMLPCARSLS